MSTFSSKSVLSMKILQNILLLCQFFIKISAKHDTSAESKNNDVEDIDKKFNLYSDMIIGNLKGSGR